MFTANRMRELMAANPFKPFRICMSDGKTYDVPNHDAALVLANCVEVGIEPNPAGFAQRVARCAYLHIATIEDLQAA